MVLSHPTQYYSPWFRWLQANAPLDLRVFYLWDFGVSPQRDPEFNAAFAWDVDLLAGYASEFVPNRARHPGTDHFWGLRNPALCGTPRRVAAGGGAAVRLPFRDAPARDRLVPAPGRAAGLPRRLPPAGPAVGRPLLKRLALRALYRQFAAVTYVGAANRAYFETLRRPGRRACISPRTPSTKACLTPVARRTTAHRADRLRADLGLPRRSPRRPLRGQARPAQAARGAARGLCRRTRPGTTLLFVGDGDDKPALQARAAAAPEADVRFLPFANQSEMPARYLLADLFVLPSRGNSETWGLAVNEAMHMGVPCLVSDVVGCQRDLVTDGETGWVFRAGDAAQPARKTRRGPCSASRAMDRRSGSGSLARVAGYTYEQATAGLLQALAAIRAMRLTP